MAGTRWDTLGHVKNVPVEGWDTPFRGGVPTSPSAGRRGSEDPICPNPNPSDGSLLGRRKSDVQTEPPPKGPSRGRVGYTGWLSACMHCSTPVSIYELHEL